MPLDLSQLDQEPHAETASAPLAPMDAFEEDPDNPRKEFDGPAFYRLVEDIRARGILQPPMVTARPDGKLRIHFGARRYRAAIQAGLTQPTS